MTGWLSDLRIALRLLRRRPGWTAAVLATLALAIGEARLDLETVGRALQAE